MALNLAHMLSTSGLQPAPLITRPARPELIVKDEASPEDRGLGASKPDGVVEHTRGRTRIWEFGSNLHCSIIGTCLTTAELRQLLGKLNISGAAVASDHELH